MLTLPQVAEVLGEVLKRDITFREVPLEEWCKDKVPAFQELMTYLTNKQESAVPFVPQDIEEILGEPPTTLKRWAKDHKALFRK